MRKNLKTLRATQPNEFPLCGRAGCSRAGMASNYQRGDKLLLGRGVQDESRSNRSGGLKDETK